MCKKLIASIYKQIMSRYIVSDEVESHGSKLTHIQLHIFYLSNHVDQSSPIFAIVLVPFCVAFHCGFLNSS